MIKLNSFQMILKGILLNTKSIFTTLYGYICIGFVGIFGFITTEWKPFAVLLFLIVVDLIFGILVALKNKKFILSTLMINTVVKMGVYSTVFLCVGVLEAIIHDVGFIGLKIVALVGGACELWSVSANMLILKPNMPFLKIFRLQLKGEIESKVGKNVDDILK